MDLAFVWLSARKDLIRRLRDPMALLLWIGIPLVIGVLVSSVSGSDGKVRPRGRLLFADLDDSFASRAVSSAFAQGELGEMFDVESVALDDGRARIRDGDASALIVVPLGFGEALLLDQPTTIEVVKNPARTILPRIAEETLGMGADLVFYVQRIAGERLRPQIQSLIQGPPIGQRVLPASFIAGFSVEINNTVERILRYVDPPLIEVEVEAPAEESGPSPRTNFALLFFPTMLFLALFFVAQGLSEDLWRERAQGTLRRAVSAPQSAGTLLLGKFLSALILIAGISAVGMVFAAVGLGVSWVHLPLGLLWITLTGGFLYACMGLIQVHAKSQRGGDLITNSILFPLSMLGGAFFPFEVMPDWMAAIGKRTPNGWALEQYKAILFGEAAWGELALGALGLVLLSAGLTWWTCRRVERAFLGS